ncbi:hypothetical protein [Silvibacterium dinghuense]|uniref:Uncharacterized protein n=1 Tax=Silvibacterium dinghuense TaxID=1560006 RepID=A0A4Q1SJ45_9BACT|nr:hypothetical protein [Silvibacterium dinghuense]RXS97439.1 hypothetical protein ESZ00_05955 [Silvibacterium dinghuense]
MQSIAFPMRLGESGLLRREDRATGLIGLLQVMARTPQGSWRGCPSFGLRDLFEMHRQRADTPRLMMERINTTLQDLGIDEFRVVEVTRELSPGRETDTYAVLLEGGAADTLTTMLTLDP